MGQHIPFHLDFVLFSRLLWYSRHRARRAALKCAVTTCIALNLDYLVDYNSSMVRAGSTFFPRNASRASGRLAARGFRASRRFALDW